MSKRKKWNITDPVESRLEIEETNTNGISGLLDESIVEARKVGQENNALDGQLYSATEAIARTICIQMPALAPRFLLQSEGWPLGRFFLIDGLQESCKSAFSNEVGVWHRQACGNHIVIETEQKDGSALRDSFFNYDRNAWQYTRCHSQDEWNRAFFWWLDRIHGIMDGHTKETVDELTGSTKRIKVPGKGRIAPISLVVDSLSAVLIDRIKDEMIKEGAPELNHPLGALLLSNFFKVGPKQLCDYPITFMAISHLRENPHPKFQNVVVRNITGGMAPKFQMTTEIEMRRKRPGQYARNHKYYGEIYSIDLYMQVRKNSLGGHEGIGVEMSWYYDCDNRDPITKERRQKSFFDWDTASIELLLDCMVSGEDGKGFSTKRSRELRELVDLHKDDNKRTIWSHTLDIPEDDKLSYHDAGKVLEKKIQTNSDFCLQLYEIMGIRRRRMFIPGKDYLQQIKEYTVELEAAEKNVVIQPIAELPLPAEVKEFIPAPTVESATDLVAGVPPPPGS